MYQNLARSFLILFYLNNDKEYKILFRVKDNDPYNSKKFSYSEVFSYELLSDSLLCLK